MYLSSHRTAESEAFDPATPERQFAWVPRDLDYPRHLRRIARARWNLKHVVDRLSPEFNATLARETTEAGYAHLILDRRDAAARVASLAVAERHGTWDPSPRTTRILGAIERGEIAVDLDPDQLVRRQERAQEMLNEVRTALVAANAVWYEVAFEDLYGCGVADGLDAFVRVADHVGLAWYGDVARIRRLLVSGGQNTGAALEAVPEVSDLREALAAD